MSQSNTRRSVRECGREPAQIILSRPNWQIKFRRDAAKGTHRRDTRQGGCSKMGMQVRRVLPACRGRVRDGGEIGADCKLLEIIEIDRVQPIPETRRQTTAELPVPGVASFTSQKFGGCAEMQSMQRPYLQAEGRLKSDNHRTRVCWHRACSSQTPCRSLRMSRGTEPPLSGWACTTSSKASPGCRASGAAKSTFAYRDAKGRPVRDARTLDRIRSLVIPPAWKARLDLRASRWPSCRQPGAMRAAGSSIAIIPTGRPHETSRSTAR